MLRAGNASNDMPPPETVRATSTTSIPHSHVPHHDQVDPNRQQADSAVRDASQCRSEQRSMGISRPNTYPARCARWSVPQRSRRVEAATDVLIGDTR